MSLPAPISINDQLVQIRDVLNGWSMANGYQAVFKIVSNLQDLWAQSLQNSQSPMGFVFFEGETARGSFAELAPWHRVDREFVVRLKKGRGYLVERGDSVANDGSGEISFVSILEQVRDKIRCILSISEELPSIDYRGIKSVRLGDQVIDAYDIRFTTANDIPIILTQPN